MDDKELYRYTLVLDPAVEAEKELMDLIRDRDLLEFPTVKLYLVKNLVRKTEKNTRIEQRLSDLEYDLEEMKQILGELLQTKEETRLVHEEGNGIPGREGDSTGTGTKSSTVEKQLAENPENAAGTENDFAAAFLKNYSR